MCYERMFFSLRRKSKAPAREEMKTESDTEHSRVRVQPIRSATERKVPEKKVEHESEEIA